MTEKPILFKAEMVRAILDGRKTQTRRILKAPDGDGWFRAGLGEIRSPHPKKGKWGQFFKREIWPGSGKYEMDLTPCPFGKIGEELWVRETFRIGAWHGQFEKDNLLNGNRDGSGKFAFDYSATAEENSTPWCHAPVDGVTFTRYVEQSIIDFEKAEKTKSVTVWREEGKEYNWERGNSPCRWRSSRFMPRWASRIQLRITDVRVERVQDISEGDAKKEGITQGMCWGEGCSAVDWFKSLWNNINAKRGYDWESNPYVWVIEFERIKP